MSSSTPARPGPARRIWRSRCRSGPARPATASRSPPPSNGSTASRPPNIATRSTTNCDAWSATTCSSSTRSATCPSNAKRPTCSRPGRPPLRTRLDHRHIQPRLRSLGRDPRRRHGRRRPDRPPRPPRPHGHPQGQELPTARAGGRSRARGSGYGPPALRLNRDTTLTWRTFRFLILAQFSVPIDSFGTGRPRCGGEDRVG